MHTFQLQRPTPSNRSREDCIVTRREMACIKERIKGSKVTPHLGLCCQNGIEGLRTILVVLLLLRFRVKQTLTRDDPGSWPSAWQDPHEKKAKWQYSPQGWVSLSKSALTSPSTGSSSSRRPNPHSLRRSQSPSSRSPPETRAVRIMDDTEQGMARWGSPRASSRCGVGTGDRTSDKVPAEGPPKT